MKVKTKGAIVNGNRVGTVIDLPTKDAEALVKRGYAENVVEKKESAPKKTTKKRKPKAGVQNEE